MSQVDFDNKITDSNSKAYSVRISMVLLKGLLLFIALNIVFAFLGIGSLSKFSLYNKIFPGRLRLPFGENPKEAYNFSLNDLNAMFASHEISDKEKPSDEFRVIIIGDSSSWGILQKPEETLTGLINNKNMSCLGRNVKAYNLGYPTLSLTKDIMILDQGLSFNPDLIIWPVTLEAFPLDKQLTSPIVAENMDLIQQLDDILPDSITQLIPNKEFGASLVENSIIGQRRQLADLIRLQLYGFMWASTGIDQFYPTQYEHAQVDLQPDYSFHSWTEPDQLQNGIIFEVINSELRLAGDVPTIIVNEPILISDGENSDIRYNFYYPRWAFDQYRKMFVDLSIKNSWHYLDLWNLIPSSEFSNSAIHMTASGEVIFANRIIDEITNSYCH